MNKKLICAIIAGVVALALIITAAVLLIKRININSPDGDSPTTSSSVSDKDGVGTASGDNGSDTVVEKGNVTVGEYKGSAGDIIDVPIKLSENPGVLAGMFIFEYDDSALEYVDYKEGNILDEYDVKADNGKISCIISASGIDDKTSDGTVIILQFKIKEGTAPGEYTVKYSKDSQISNFDEEWIKPNISDGKITVK